MRYKFKAWDKHNTQWIYRVLAGCNSDGSDYVCNLVWHEGEWTNFDEGCGTIVQYTGLTDDSGNPIYEGDILQVRHQDGDSDKYEVRYMGDQDYPAFDLVPRLDCDSNGLSHAMAVCSVEVIGNIYEHPHLLKGE